MRLLPALRAAVVALALALADTAHTFKNCYGLFPPPAEVLGYESAYFAFPSGSGFTGNKLHYVQRKPVGCSAVQ